ncbi:oligosaccharide flippase family protein [Leptogranulimonas caecicola]|uniref:oligosaccharide flippase family protein n=1 Tax=Leptogranulimonas caecicola TaxID=2894156 RepID=UPI002240FFA1|nr:oligosaccharide flippase family protein [Leptogranulimonas caecicola]
MDYRTLAKNAGTAFLAQGVAMVLSFIQTLLVPKLLGVTEYGYWQLFIFYCSYVGFAHLGLNDGVYLIKGGESRAEINKASVMSQFWFGVVFQLIISIAITTVVLQGFAIQERNYVIIFTCAYLVIHNASLFLMYLLQSMNETQKSSYATIVERLTFLVPLLIFLIIRCNSFRPFVVAYLFSSVVQLGYCLWCCRDFLQTKLEPIPTAVRDAISSIRVGFKLMIANIASQLILGIARFSIDLAWGIDAFGRLSLALSMVNFFLAFVSQASMVLFPALRQSDDGELRQFFARSRDFLSLIAPMFYLGYFPLVWILSIWLPDYASSYIYFLLLLPVCVFDSKMNICCTTFFKVLRQESRLLEINLWTCFISAFFTILGVFIFKSTVVVIGGAALSIIGRSLWSEKQLSSVLKKPMIRSLNYGELLLTALFIVLALVLPSLLAFCIYTAIYSIYLVNFGKQVDVVLRIKAVLRDILK